ncbi:hypothetical protein HA050_16385 [Iodobacter sp. HSC-16F04]|uniref:Uncharacterized protein n=1 Tax=Iodobacter violaceini TaxID=3044271 RepID=A0ABX0KV20_9NEIS|nr:hypothetical protein [Iodobacter violacea]NHQ87696.1 hypothetical protein [Iodobacter violacea]
MKAPCTLIAILATYFLIKVADAFLTGQIYSLAPLAIWGIAGWKAYKGSQSSTWVLGGLFIIGAAFTSYGALVSSRLPTVDKGFNYGYALFLAGSAAYLFLSPKLKAFQESHMASPYGR